MESKEEAAVERQKLVPDDENELDDEPLPVAVNVAAIASSPGNHKTGSHPRTPISPVLSGKVSSSGDTSRTQDSSNGSFGRGGIGCGAIGVHSNGHQHAHQQHSGTRLVYVNERNGSGRSQHQHQPNADNASGKLSDKARQTQRDDYGDDERSSQSPATRPTAAITVHAVCPSPVPLLPVAVDLHRRTTPTHPLLSSAATDAVQLAADDDDGGGGTARGSRKQRPTNETASKHSANGPSFDQRQLKHHSFVSEVPDVRHMERALLGLLEDFHMGKLKAFGYGCTMEQMTDIREQQERLARLHFELGSDPDVSGSTESGLNSQENMSQLVAKLEKLSVSIERLHSSNTDC